MTAATKLMILGSVVGAVIVVAIRRSARGGAASSAGEGRPGANDLAVAPGAGAAPLAAAALGLSDVDPAPLAHVTEAMDPDANRAAHTAAGEQRARLPVRGKNLP